MDIDINQITISQQRYIEVIYELSRKHLHAHVKSIAKYLDVSMPTVSEALKGLHKMKLINYKERKPITLTNHGLKIAKYLGKKHKIFCDFFTKVLNINSNISEAIACKIEHIDTDILWERINDFLFYIETIPCEMKVKFFNEFAVYLENKKRENR